MSRSFMVLAALMLAACGGTADVAGGGHTTSTGSTSSGSTSATTTGTSTTTGGATSTTGTSSAGTSTSTGGSSGSSICDSQNCVVYASADHDLYKVDPTTLQQTHLCTFNGALGSTTADVVTDIAVENQGTVFAITETALYTVDPASCAASKVATLSQAGTRWVGLTFTAGGKLLAADGSGHVVSINPSSGAVSSAGSFGSLACSGDLVAINDANGTIYATATDPSCSSCNDKLVTLDPNSYAATVIGDVGYTKVFGLGFWGGKLYGFTHAGLTLQINPQTGAATQIDTSSYSFSGGATTPLAPIFQ